MARLRLPNNASLDPDDPEHAWWFDEAEGMMRRVPSGIVLLRNPIPRRAELAEPLDPSPRLCVTCGKQLDKTLYALATEMRPCPKCGNPWCYGGEPGRILPAPDGVGS